MTSPRSPRAMTKVLTPKQFGEKLSAINKQMSIVFRLKGLVAPLKSGEVLQFRGKQMSKNDVRSLLTQGKERISSLQKDYSSLKKEKKRKKKCKTGKGFKNPVLVNDNMIGFFQEANLGSYIEQRTQKEIVTCDDKGNVIQEYIQTRTDTGQQRSLNAGELAVVLAGVTTPGILTSLFSVYVLVNNLQYDKMNRNLLRADDRMRQYFGESFQHLTATDAANRAENGPRYDKRGNLIAPFSVNSFRFADLQRNVSLNTYNSKQVANGEAPADRVPLLTDPTIKTRLKEEQEVVSDYLEGYHTWRDAQPSYKAAKKVREAAKKAMKAAQA